ncbi:MAG: hypothetical protein ACT4NL_12840 [Pseudomarimonas sp.]
MPDFGYTRDRLGRITQVTETRAGVSRATGYIYDLAGRLERITRHGSDIAIYALVSVFAYAERSHATTRQPRRGRSSQERVSRRKAQRPSLREKFCQSY